MAESGQNLCCCGKINIIKGTVYVGFVELVLIFLLFLTTLLLILFEEKETAASIYGVHSREILENKDYRLKLIVGSIVVGIIVNTVIVILLIVGAKKQNRFMLIPFLVFTVIWIIGLGLRLFDCVLLFDDDTPTAVTALITGVIIGIVLALQIWFFVVILACFKYLAEVNRPPVAYARGQQAKCQVVFMDM